MMTLAERVTATEKTLAKFRGRPFDWKTGATCIHLARTQARNMRRRVPALPRFTSAVGARTALRKTGHASLEALLDSLFERIAPAAMLVGDVALGPGEEALGAIAISDGFGTLMGWHADAPLLSPIAGAVGDLKGAWRL